MSDDWQVVDAPDGQPVIVPSDWQVVKKALDEFYIPGSQFHAALARLHEREAQHVSHYQEQAQAEHDRAVAAEARVKEERAEAFMQANRASLAEARVAELGAALRGLTGVAMQYMNTGRGDLDGWIEIARRALEKR